MTDDLHQLDPRNLIREAYRIDGITIWDCRTIFLDWALGQKNSADTRAEVAALLAHYGPDWPEHPMTAVLTAGLAKPPEARRRGGRRSRQTD